MGALEDYAYRHGFHSGQIAHSAGEPCPECDYFSQQTLKTRTALTQHLASDTPQPDRNEANARLIAAAPEMYEALCALLTEYDSRNWRYPATPGCPAELARAVLAKVEGVK